MRTGTADGCCLIVTCHLFTLGGVVFAGPCVAVACLICSCCIVVYHACLARFITYILPNLLPTA